MSQFTGFPLVMCPGCRISMDVDATEALPDGQNKTTYRCKQCGTETTRIFKIDNLRAQAGLPASQG